MGLDDIVSDAVDAAATPEPPASSADTSGASPSSVPDAGASSPPAPAAPSGSESASTSARSTDPATIPPSAPVAPAEPSAGEPPREKWTQVLANARTKARTEALAEVGLQGAVDPNVRAHVALLTQDPVAYYHALGQSLQQSGQLRPAPQTAPQPAAPEPALPDADLVTADGTPVYSRDGMLAAASHLMRQALAQFREEQDERMMPLVQTAQKIHTEEIRAHSRNVASEIFGEVKTWPHFETLRERITDLVKAQPLSRDIRAQVEAAYNQAFREYLPTYESALRASTRQDALGQVTTTARGARRASTPAPNATVGLASARSTSGDSLEARISRAFDHATQTLR
jgi:hypothetical protein